MNTSSNLCMMAAAVVLSLLFAAPVFAQPSGEKAPPEASKPLPIQQPQPSTVSG